MLYYRLYIRIHVDIIIQSNHYSSSSIHHSLLTKMCCIYPRLCNFPIHNQTLKVTRSGLQNQGQILGESIILILPCSQHIFSLVALLPKCNFECDRRFYIPTPYIPHLNIYLFNLYAVRLPGTLDGLQMVKKH